jgi:DNA (cytosine-5)-methyltransferase 1
MWDRGGLLPLPPSVRVIDASGCSSLLGTPMARDWKDGIPADVETNGFLGRPVWDLLPTPAAGMPNDAEDAADWQERWERNASKEVGATRAGVPLAIAVQLLPTPTSQAAKHGSTPDESANAFGYNLWDLPHLLPTPNAVDADRGPDYARMNRVGSGGDDLVTLAGRLSGDRLRPRSTDGSGSSDGALPFPPSTDD